MKLKEEMKKTMYFQWSIWCDVGARFESPPTLLYFTPGTRRHLHGMMAFITAAV